MLMNRRKLITGLISFAAAPAIVRAESLMKVKMIKPDFDQATYLNILIDKMVRNSQYGKFAAVPRVWISYEDCIKIWPIPEKDIYLDYS